MPLRNPCRWGVSLLTCGRAVKRTLTPLRPGLLSLCGALFIHGPGQGSKLPWRVSQPASGLNVYADPFSRSLTPEKRGGGGLFALRCGLRFATGRTGRGPSSAMRCSVLLLWGHVLFQATLGTVAGRRVHTSRHCTPEPCSPPHGFTCRLPF
ncbi:hypothetical protein NDU88_010092 [Pleurodeles waltl]|uniref:Uncharacterized protein n=1 Tax=Pleurodeles waltl TaxID=8319 RepID=A0AAV7QZA3_PLEWA|nr:hypothetical protein NDU88_010092 [Pleurodeles waltl]